MNHDLCAMHRIYKNPGICFIAEYTLYIYIFCISSQVSDTFSTALECKKEDAKSNKYTLTRTVMSWTCSTYYYQVSEWPTMPIHAPRHIVP